HPGFSRGLSLVILGSGLRAGMGICYKFGLSSGADYFTMLASSGLVWMVVGLAYGYILERHKKPEADTIGFGILSGGLISGIVLFMMLALRLGDASTVLPLTQLSFLG